MTRSSRRAALIAIVATAPLVGCTAARQLAQSYLRKPTHSGMTSPLRRAIESAIDQAIAAFDASWARRVERRPEADAREEEQGRLRAGEAQLFYPEQCTAPGSKARSEAGAGERDAQEAYAAGDYARAAKFLQEEYEDLADGLGDVHQDVARVQNRLAVAHLAAGDPRAAVPAAVGALEARKELLRALGPQGGKADPAQVLRASLDVAESETTVGLVFRAAGAFDRARQSFAQALELRSQHLGEAHLCVAQSQNALGELEYLTGNYAKASELYRKSLATRRKQLPEGHRDLAQSYVNLGALHRTTGLFEQARADHEQALAIRRKLGERHPELAESYHAVASLYRAKGDFSEAEKYYEKALAIRNVRFPNGLEVAATETAIAELAMSYGDYDRAERLLGHAHGIRRARLPPDHPDLAESFADQAKLHHARLDFQKSEQEQLQALAIWEKKLGPRHLAVAFGAASLGELHLSQGRLDQAELRFNQARAIREAKLGADNPATAESLHQLGILQYARCDYARAEPLLRAAIDVRARKLGEGHPDTAASLSYLAALLVATNRPDEALQVFRRVQRISEGLVESVASMASEARFEALLRFLRAQEEVVYSLLDEKDLADRAAPVALSMALLRKGRSIDEAASVSSAVYQGLSAEDRARFDELRTLRAQVARQRLAPVEGVGSDDGAALAARVEAFERDLAARSAGIRARREVPAVDDVAPRVAAALPADAVLVEIVRYRAYQFRAAPGEPRWRAPRYAALVLHANGAIETAGLGEAGPIDDGVKRFLRGVTDRVQRRVRLEDDREVTGVAQAIEFRTIEPIRASLEGNKVVVLAPDGQLNLLPFWALHDGRAYLIDHYTFTYVTSGRDLLRPRVASTRSEAALFASPQFAAGGAAQAPTALATRALEIVEDPTPGKPLVRLSAGALKLTAPPSPLPGTEREAQAIKRLLPRARLVLGAAATKEQFLGVQAPAVVHVATHGLFRPERAGEGGSVRGVEVANALLSPVIPAKARSEPLLNSMLLWTNASSAVSTAEGSAYVLEPAGLATALEVAGMNLWGTRLVVLSACETGRGHLDDLGQGVYGLRRAVMVAGAETLVTSLWKVDDDVTRELMTSYYARLLAGRGRGEALRDASLAVRKKHPEPWLWAPFIAIGQAGPVEALR